MEGIAVIAQEATLKRSEKTVWWTLSIGKTISPIQFQRIFNIERDAIADNNRRNKAKLGENFAHFRQKIDVYFENLFVEEKWFSKKSLIRRLHPAIFLILCWFWLQISKSKNLTIIEY